MCCVVVMARLVRIIVVVRTCLKAGIPGIRIDLFAAGALPNSFCTVGAAALLDREGCERCWVVQRPSCNQHLVERGFALLLRGVQRGQV